MWHLFCTTFQLDSLTQNKGAQSKCLRRSSNRKGTAGRSKIEEEIFYPAFKQSIRTKSDAHLYNEALEEHHVVDLVMPKIKDADADSEEFAAKAKVLKDLIEHHAEEEETQMFPKARKAMGTAMFRELGEELRQRKQELSTGMSGRNMERMTGNRRRVA